MGNFLLRKTKTDFSILGTEYVQQEQEVIILTKGKSRDDAIVIERKNISIAPEGGELKDRRMRSEDAALDYINLNLDQRTP